MRAAEGDQGVKQAPWALVDDISEWQRREHRPGGRKGRAGQGGGVGDRAEEGG